MMATFLHLGKPDQDVVEKVHNKLSATFHHDPIIAHITKQYLQGRPFCCEICEALTAKGRDKLLMCPCRTIAYCSRDCQVKNWKKHKDECQGALNEKGESEAMVKERKITGKGEGGKKGTKGKRGELQMFQDKTASIDPILLSGETEDEEGVGDLDETLFLDGDDDDLDDLDFEDDDDDDDKK